MDVAWKYCGWCDKIKSVFAFGWNSDAGRPTARCKECEKRCAAARTRH